MHWLKRSSRQVGFSFAALLVTLSGCQSRGPGEEPDDWHVVLLCLDTLRADHLGTYGYPRFTSPALDRLTRSGLSFRWCISQSASTMPSHRAVFQSRVASHADTSNAVLAEVLREAGYQTVGLTGGGNVSAELGFERGFDRYDEDEGGLAVTVPKFVEWLDQRDETRPFFAFLHTYDVHLPYDPPRPLERLFEGDYDGIVTGATSRELSRKFRRAGEWADWEGALTLSLADRRRLEALYDAEIRKTDLWVSELLRVLEDRQLLEQTLFVIMSDHGEEFWEHGSLIHSHTVYEELVHVPWIVTAPFASASDLTPGIVSEVVRNMDIAPSILDVLGIPIPESFRGRPLISGVLEEELATVPAISEMKQWKSIRQGDWKLVVDVTENSLALYDLANDPGEQYNVSGAHQELTQVLQSALFEVVRSANVDELHDGPVSEELLDRLRALGYLDP